MPSSDPPPRRSPNRVQTGRDFEQRATHYFRERGFTILDRNWRDGRREIDLIVQREDLVVFVEVKAVSSMKYGHPAERVDRRKIHHLKKAAQRYLLDKNIVGCDLRFDVITYTGGNMEHFPAAFTADD